MKKDDIVYLRHIDDAIGRICKYTNGKTIKDFLNNEPIQALVIQQLEIIGEATKRLSMEIRDRYPDVKWKGMAGLRDKLIHGYFGVDLNMVWEAVERDIPVLKARIKDIIRKETKNGPKK